MECSQIPAEYVTPGRIKYHTWVSLFLEMVKKSMSAVANIGIKVKTAWNSKVCENTGSFSKLAL